MIPFASPVYLKMFSRIVNGDFSLDFSSQTRGFENFTIALKLFGAGDNRRGTGRVGRFAAPIS